MACGNDSCACRINNNFFGEVVKMNIIQITTFLLALINLIAISISIYYKKHNLSIALSILEIVLVYISLNFGN